MSDLCSEKNLRTTAIAQTVFAIVQIAGAFVTGSQALLSDAIHAFVDGIAVFIAWIGEILSHTKSAKNSHSRNYFSYLAAIIVAVLVLIGAIIVIINCVHILYTGEVSIGHANGLDTIGMTIFAVIGLLYSVFFSHRLHRGHSHNEKTLALHLFMDAGNWLITILGALIIHYTHFIRLDAVLGLLYMTLVIAATLKRLQATLIDFYKRK